MTKISVTTNAVAPTAFDVLSKGVFFIYKETLFVKSGSSYATMLQDATDLKVKTGEIYYFMEGEKVTVVDSVRIHVNVTGS